MPPQHRAVGHSGTGAPDAGFFGPDSELWRVLRERSVVMGGMRALLMHALHPLVAAATAQTGRYEQDTWSRHERTLQLVFTLVFGTRPEATRAAQQINGAHRAVRGVDAVTGLPYDARNVDLLLWVHASLISSFLLFEKLTVGALDAVGRQRFHDEAKVMAALLGLPPSCIPSTVSDLESWIEAQAGNGLLRPTAGSDMVSAIIRGNAGDPVGYRFRTAGFLALHTLPSGLRDLYGVNHGHWDDLKLQALTGAIRVGRLARPAGARFIQPAISATARMRGGEPAPAASSASRGRKAEYLR